MTLQGSALPDADFDRLAALLRGGRLDELDAMARVFIERHPADGRCWQMLGVSFLARDRHAEAFPLLSQASRLMPDNPSIWDNLGVACHKLKDYDQADVCFRRSTQLQPDRLTAWLNWSACAHSAGEAGAAEAHARRALQLSPQLADAWLNLGNALDELGRLDEAEQAYMTALNRRPGWPEAELSYAMLLDKRGRQQEAIALFSRLIEAAPDDWRAHANLGRIYSAMGRSRLATASYRNAVRFNPDVAEANSGLLFLRLYEEGADSASVFEDHRAYGAYLDARHRADWPRHSNDRDPTRRLRVGFVSGDFRAHSVAHFFEPFLRNLDRDAIEILLYSCHRAEDETTRRLRSDADAWVQATRMTDDQLAARIQADRIDILVDLAGHSAFNRLEVFARRPAPVQVSWLGYPSTTGLGSIDYRPVYRVACPPGLLDAQFTEKLVYLPCAPAFEHPADAPAVGPLPALARGRPTFASLNRSDKLGDGVIQTWSRILHALPDARLLIGAVGEEAVKAELTERFRRSGIPVDRLDIRPRLPMRQYLELHNEIDILLDPFPFSGLTTTEHAVWMGVPVLSLAGDALVKRQGLIVMGALGLADWVVDDEEAYVRKAVAVASDPAALAELRAGLRARVQACPISQPDSEAACMSKAFRTMWQRWCAGLEPESFEVEV